MHILSTIFTFRFACFSRRTRPVVGLIANLLFVCPINVAFAQDLSYPTKSIRLIVPFTPGGTTDILARAIGQQLSIAWNQAVVIENVPGAGGSIGADKVAKAAPDGYTLLMGHIGTLAVNPTLYPNLPYDPIKHFAPVAWVARVPNVLVVHPSLSAMTVADLVKVSQQANAQGRVGLNYGSGGNGSAAHIATEYFRQQTKSELTHIPYRGTAPGVTDLLAGQIQMMFTGAPAVMQHVRSGHLRALGVSSRDRMQAFPQLPTIAESGYPGFEADQWYGIVAPAGISPAIVRKLNQQINVALTSKELKTRLQQEGAEATPSAPQEFAALIVREIARWKPVLINGKVKPE